MDRSEQHNQEQNRSNGAAAKAGTVVNATAGTVGSSMGQIAAKITSGSERGDRGGSEHSKTKHRQMSPQAERSLDRKKQKKAAHRRRLRAASARG